MKVLLIENHYFVLRKLIKVDQLHQMMDCLRTLVVDKSCVGSAGERGTAKHYLLAELLALGSFHLLPMRHSTDLEMLHVVAD